MSEIPTLLKGEWLATRILNELKAKIENLREKPCIAIILVGNDEASKVFVGLKEKVSQDIGIEPIIYRLEAITKEDSVLRLIQDLNETPKVHGILVQLPLPPHIDENRVLGSICPEKDVDGLTPKNVGNLLLGEEGITPCTADSIITILEEYGIKIEGKDVVIINRSNLIGKPLAIILIRKSATVTVCHSKTKNLAEHTRHADIIITATGRPGFLNGNMIKEDVVVIDAGYAKREGRICGDVDFETVSKKASAITPVPGGVGPLTVALVFKNLMRCYESRSPQTSTKS